MAMPSGSELLLIFGIVVLLFGAKKIPDLAKGLGQGIRNFKNEMKDNEPPASPPPAQEAPKQVESTTDTTTTTAQAPQDQAKQA